MVAGRWVALLPMLFLSIASTEVLSSESSRRLALIDRAGSALYLEDTGSLCLEDLADLDLRVTDTNSAPPLTAHISEITEAGKATKFVLIDDQGPAGPADVALTNNNDGTQSFEIMDHTSALLWGSNGGRVHIVYQWWNGESSKVELVTTIEDHSCFTARGKVIFDANGDGIFNTTQKNSEYGIPAVQVNVTRDSPDVKAGDADRCGTYINGHGSWSFNPFPVASVVTDANGDFEIPHLARSGYYTIESVQYANQNGGGGLINTLPVTGLLPVCESNASSNFQFLMTGYRIADLRLQTSYQTPVLGDVKINYPNPPAGINFKRVPAVNGGEPVNGVVSDWVNGKFKYTPNVNGPAVDPVTGVVPAYVDSFGYQACQPVPGGQEFCSQSTIYVAVASQKIAKSSGSVPVTVNGSRDVMNLKDGVVTSTSCQIRSTILRNSNPAYIKVNELNGAIDVLANAPAGHYEIDVLLFIDTSTPGACDGVVAHVANEGAVILDAQNPAVSKSIGLDVAAVVVANPDSNQAAVGGRSGGFLGANDIYLKDSQFSLVSGPSHGNVQVAIDGSYTWIVGAGFVGADEFTYKLCLPEPNQQQCSAAKVSLNVVQADQAILDLAFAKDSACCKKPLRFVVNGGSTNGSVAVNSEPVGGASCAIVMDKKKVANSVTSGVLIAQVGKLQAKKKGGVVPANASIPSCNVSATMRGDATRKQVTSAIKTIRVLK